MCERPGSRKLISLSSYSETIHFTKQYYMKKQVNLFKVCKFNLEYFWIIFKETQLKTKIHDSL
jgi:hypothetical protein